MVYCVHSYIFMYIFWYLKPYDVLFSLVSLVDLKKVVYRLTIDFKNNACSLHILSSSLSLFTRLGVEERLLTLLYFSFGPITREDPDLTVTLYN